MSTNNTLTYGKITLTIILIHWVSLIFHSVIIEESYSKFVTILCMAKVEQALRPTLNLIFYHFKSAECVLKIPKHFILALTALRA